jgi:hypothetical protein
MPQVSEAVVGSGGVGLLKGADPDDTVMRRNSNSFTSSSHRGSSDTIYVVSGRRGGDATSGISSAFCFDFRVPEELLGVTVGPMIGSGSSGKGDNWQMKSFFNFHSSSVYELLSMLG